MCVGLAVPASSPLIWMWQPSPSQEKTVVRQLFIAVVLFSFWFISFTFFCSVPCSTLRAARQFLSAARFTIILYRISLLRILSIGRFIICMYETLWWCSCRLRSVCQPGYHPVSWWFPVGLLPTLTLYSTYSATSSNTQFVHWPLMGVLLHLIQRGGDWAGPQPAQAPPRYTKCNSPPISGQCTNHVKAVTVRCSTVLMPRLKGERCKVPELSVNPLVILVK